jgi:cell division protein FtsW
MRIMQKKVERMMITHKERMKTVQLLLGTVAILLIIGIICVYSASSVLALTHYGSAHYFLVKQLVGLLLGISIAIGMQKMEINTVKAAAPYLFWGSLLLTAATLLPSISHLIHGSRRWLAIAGFSFQPSELLKVTLPLYIATFLEKAYLNNTRRAVAYVVLGTIVSATSMVLLLQPDFGLTVTLLVTTLALLFIAQFNLRHIAYLLGGLSIISIILIAMRPYRIRRLLTFLDPWSDPRGAGFQIIQSLIAIGSGHWTGMGIGHSKQKFFYLPMQHTDFIFAIIAEEIGFIGCFFLIALYVLFLYAGLRLATMVPTLFAQLTIAGYTILIGLQTIINMAVATGLAPTKGMGLPFMSYGNSALIASCMMIGIITLFARKV